jgi:hypothetical protein
LHKKKRFPQHFIDVTTSRNPIRGKYTGYLAKIGKLGLGHPFNMPKCTLNRSRGKDNYA